MQVNSEASVLLEFWTVLICGTAPVFHLVQTHLDNVRQFSARLEFVRQGGMTVPKNDTYKDYVRYAEHCLNMVATTTDQESRCIQREMAAKWLRLADTVRHPRRSKQMQMG